MPRQKRKASHSRAVGEHTTDTSMKFCSKSSACFPCCRRNKPKNASSRLTVTPHAAQCTRRQTQQTKATTAQHKLMKHESNQAGSQAPRTHTPHPRTSLVAYQYYPLGSRNSLERPRGCICIYFQKQKNITRRVRKTYSQLYRALQQ